MSAIYWLILFIVLLVIEAITLGLTTIWFAGGAIVCFVLALLNVNPTLQWFIFCGVSLVLLFVTRPVALTYLEGNKVKTNVDSLLGRMAVVTKTVDNLKGEGEVEVNGLTWTARSSEDGTVISEGSRVLIREVQGVKLIVEEKREG